MRKEINDADYEKINENLRFVHGVIALCFNQSCSVATTFDDVKNLPDVLAQAENKLSEAMRLNEGGDHA